MANPKARALDEAAQELHKMALALSLSIEVRPRQQFESQYAEFLPIRAAHASPERIINIRETLLMRVIGLCAELFEEAFKKGATCPSIALDFYYLEIRRGDDIEVHTGCTPVLTSEDYTTVYQDRLTGGVVA